MASTTYEATIWLLISTGCLSVVTALLGYTAIAFENRCLLAWYTFILSYRLVMENTEAVDKIQTKYSCCGSSGFSDWAGSPWLLLQDCQPWLWGQGPSQQYCLHWLYTQVLY